MEKSRTKVDASVVPYSRYRLLDRIRYDDDTAIIESPNVIRIPKSVDDKYIIVTDDVENRLDLISYKFYNTVKLWWAIAAASNLINPFDVPVGTRLRIPAFETAVSDEVV